jgi:hypothetical protein
MRIGFRARERKMLKLEDAVTGDRARPAAARSTPTTDQAARIATLGLFVLAAGCSGVSSAPPPAAPAPGESWRVLASDGAWSWFSDPRAVYRDGRTYSAWVTSGGDIVVSALDHRADTVSTHILHERLDADDHASPSLLIRPDGRILVFYSMHGDSCVRLSVSRSPGDIAIWEDERCLRLNTGGGRDDYCYTNPVYLADENRYFLFWRGSRWKPCFSTSPDGISWRPGQMLFSRRGALDTNRPYVKVGGGGRDRIHFAITDGHPRADATANLYYVCYRDGKFWRADGDSIGDLEHLPINPHHGDLVYDARTDHVPCWVWDIAADSQEHPIIVYTRFPDVFDHRYHYARWTGTRWEDHEICPAGFGFQGRGTREGQFEPYYSGGITLDHGDPSRVYLSRRVGVDASEIERWTTPDGGASWTVEAITDGSARHNVRPVVARGAPPGELPHLLWMNVRSYAYFTEFQSTVRMDLH